MSGHHDARVGRSSGLTLVELMVTVAVLAILAAMATPSFSSMLGAYRADAAAQELKAALDLARSEAIKRGSAVQACPSSNGSSCTANGTNWASGWLVLAGAGNIVSVSGAVNSSLTFVSSSAGAVSFQSLGQISGATPSFTITHTASAVNRYVCLSSAGSSKVQNSTC